jgi:hypothetical protein
MPCCEFEEEASDDAVMVFGEQALENWYCALPEPKMSINLTNTNLKLLTHLKNVFKISCSQLLQPRDI